MMLHMLFYSDIIIPDGGLAQPGEHSPHTRKVAGSSPAVSTKKFLVVFLNSYMFKKAV